MADTGKIKRKDAKTVTLNDLQKLLLKPVAALMGRHRPKNPITLNQITDAMNSWAHIFGYIKGDESVVRRDIEKVVQYLRIAKKSERLDICNAGGSRGVYLPEIPEDYDVHIGQLESRMKWLALNLKCAKQGKRNLALRVDTPEPIQPDIFYQAIENLPAQPGRHGNLLPEPSPGNTGGGNKGKYDD